MAAPTKPRARVPPGQTETTNWPVLHEGPVPRFDAKTWTFRTFGLVAEPLTLRWEEYRALPRATVTADFHCVTTWSRLDNRWEGVAIAEILRRTRPDPRVRFVVAHGHTRYTTNLPFEFLDDDDVLLADQHDSRPLEPVHGGPMRLIVPKLYAWKSAKWLTGLEFLERDAPGFWEVRGYHNRGDPWDEERYG
ncbi:MAG TPA: sulfite oxidase-like oxidoreductase [Myxococcota bacterium]|jgi:DMSO/TMAO reductase YedYZ molybdopterin-dependent catalytic subunit|nr:sulfite oxidase-like oxidoreductase [Myxococcota bacterium]